METSSEGKGNGSVYFICVLSLCVVVLVQYSVWLLVNSSIQKKGVR